MTVRQYRENPFPWLIVLAPVAIGAGIGLIFGTKSGCERVSEGVSTCAAEAGKGLKWGLGLMAVGGAIWMVTR